MYGTQRITNKETIETHNEYNTIIQMDNLVYYITHYIAIVSVLQANRLSSVKKKTENMMKATANRMQATTERTAYLKKRRETTARRMAAADALRQPEKEKIDAESLLPRKINNESVIDM